MLSQANLSFYCLSVCIHVGESVICHETLKGPKKGEKTHCEGEQWSACDMRSERMLQGWEGKGGGTQRDVSTPGKEKQQKKTSESIMM